MEELDRFFYATAMRSKDRIQVYVSMATKRALDIHPGDELEVRIRKTGRIGTRRPNAFKKVNGEAQPNTRVKVDVSQAKPSAAPTQHATEQLYNGTVAAPPGVKLPDYSKVQEEDIERLFAAKKKGASIEAIKSAFEQDTGFAWEEIPEQTRKNLDPDSFQNAPQSPK